jgi:hypothetical protein
MGTGFTQSHKVHSVKTFLFFPAKFLALLAILIPDLEAASAPGSDAV